MHSGILAASWLIKVRTCREIRWKGGLFDEFLGILLRNSMPAFPGRVKGLKVYPSSINFTPNWEVLVSGLPSSAATFTGWSSIVSCVLCFSLSEHAFVCPRRGWSISQTEDKPSRAGRVNAELNEKETPEQWDMHPQMSPTQQTNRLNRSKVFNSPSTFNLS